MPSSAIFAISLNISVHLVHSRGLQFVRWLPLSQAAQMGFESVRYGQRRARAAMTRSRVNLNLLFCMMLMFMRLAIELEAVHVTDPSGSGGEIGIGVVLHGFVDVEPLAQGRGKAVVGD